MKTKRLGTIPSFAGKEMIFWSCPIVIIGTTLWGIYTQPILILATTEWWAIKSANNLIQFLWPSYQLVDMVYLSVYQTVRLEVLNSLFLINIWISSSLNNFSSLSMWAHYSLFFVYRHHTLAFSQIKFIFWKKKYNFSLSTCILGNKVKIHFTCLQNENLNRLDFVVQWYEALHQEY